MKEDNTKILFKDQETGISISVIKNYDNCDKCFDVNVKTWQEIEADEMGISLDEFKLMKKEESLNDKIFYEKKNYLEKLERQRINNDLLLSNKGLYLKELYGEKWAFLFGWLMAYFRNFFLAFYIYRLKKKKELLSFRDFMDHF